MIMASFGSHTTETGHDHGLRQTGAGTQREHHPATEAWANGDSSAHARKFTAKPAAAMTSIARGTRVLGVTLTMLSEEIR
jgi:hypothetical protein